MPPGYDDTPLLPNSPWRVHDARRSLPEVVISSRVVTEAPAPPPSDAVILFDGSDLSQWESLGGGAARWMVEGGYLEVAPGTGNIRTCQQFGDCQLHLEWCAPAEVRGDSQGRGNSGVFLMERYEIQVLDGYDNPTYADGITAAIYGQYPPLVNACRPPGVWQTYDLLWTAPRFEGERLVSPAYVTLLHNGVVVHHHRALIGSTGHKVVGEYRPHPPTGALMLQDHNDPVRYRNLWLRRLESTE